MENALGPVKPEKQAEKMYKTGEFKMTHQVTANRFSLFSLMAPVVASILSWR